jgi:ribosomal protein S18 acetylase RimI-like enzyme
MQAALIGRSVRLRPVQPWDDSAEQVFVRGLSPASRLLRFHIGIRELPPRLLHAMTHVDQRKHIALVAERIGESEAPGIVADARYVLLDDDPTIAEFAIAVADEWQGQGLGRELLQHLMQHARERGIKALVGDVLYDNDRMIALVRALGGRVTHHLGDAGLVQARLPLER